MRCFTTAIATCAELNLKPFRATEKAPDTGELHCLQMAGFCSMLLTYYRLHLRSHTMIYRPRAMIIKHSIKKQYQTALQTSLLRTILPCGKTNPESLHTKDSTGSAINLSPVFCPTLARYRGRISPALAEKGQRCTLLKKKS